MKTEQYLSQIERLKSMIENKVEEIKVLEDMACGISSPTTDKDRIDVSLDADKIGNAISKIIDKEKEIDSLIGSYIDKYDKIVSQIDSMENTDNYRVLSARFIQMQKFGDIEARYGWSRAKSNRIFNSALFEFEKKYGKEYL